MKILQINTVVNSGSTGRIAEEIGRQLLANGHRSLIAFGRNPRPSASETVQIGGRWSQLAHLALTRATDRHGFGSGAATTDFLKKIEAFAPDVIHLHNVHGYYLNIEILFDFLKRSNLPVVWTLHDCWAFTGHCAHFERIGCDKWRATCGQCPLTRRYPASWGLDQSARNQADKRRLFTQIKNMIVVAPSDWLADHARRSFLGAHDVRTLRNGVDLNRFQPRRPFDLASLGLRGDQKIVLGVASTWTAEKGLLDFVELSKTLSDDHRVVLVGLSEKQKAALPPSVTGILRTESVEALAGLYSAAAVFANPTYSDNFPSANIEALACGTPVATYRTGGSPEAIDASTGSATPVGDVAALRDAILDIASKDREAWRIACRARAEANFDGALQSAAYLSFYNELLNEQ